MRVYTILTGFLNLYLTGLIKNVFGDFGVVIFFGCFFCNWI